MAWPRFLKGWHKLTQLNQKGVEPTLIAWLAARPQARPLGEVDLGIDVVKALLRWNPEDRATMATIKAMPFIAQSPQRGGAWHDDRAGVCADKR